MDRRVVEDAIAVGVDLDRAPLIVGQVDIDLAVKRCRAEEDLAAQSVVSGFGHQCLDRRRHGLRTRSAKSFRVVGEPQPEAESH